MKKNRQVLIAISAAAATVCLQSCGNAGKLSTPYIDPDQFTKITFGSQSHWAQPWRAYSNTVPASVFVKGVGINFNVIHEDPELIAKMLGSHGIHGARTEIGWANLQYADDSKLIPAYARIISANLLAMKKNGIRPLVLLNANQGAPCPFLMSDRVLTADAHKGDTTVALKDVSGLKVGYSGLTYVASGIMAELLITKIDGNTVTISKPLPKELASGATVKVATLKYRPFSKPGTDDFKETIEGWQKYVGVVARFVADTLGTTDSKDKGFDMEIWNELTFGADYLSINNYYSGKYQDYDHRLIFTDLLTATTDYVDQHESEFTGVEFGDGFSNTIPWPAASTEPGRITAIDKHPYPARRVFPKDNPPGKNLNAKYEPDPYVPSYEMMFPEYGGSFIQTESAIRDLGPLETTVYRTTHGRNSRKTGGAPKPVTIWVTEVNVAPGADKPSLSAEEARKFQGKSTLRLYSFYLNKGASKVDIYAAMSNGRKLGDKELGIVQANFVDLATQKGATYPADDSSYTSPSLAATGRMVAKMSSGIEMNLTRPHAISLTTISDTHDHTQFTGDGTPEHPSLYDRDVFAFLPFQVNSHRFVVPYYVMTRDMMNPLAPEKFTLSLTGFDGKKASISAYDPLNDKIIPVTVDGGTGQSATVTVTATDYPYLLIIDDPSLK